MSNLTGGDAELRFTVEVTRHATGKVETFEMVGRVSADEIERAIAADEIEGDMS